jgi:hypothetical protein
LEKKLGMDRVVVGGIDGSIAYFLDMLILGSVG